MKAVTRSPVRCAACSRKLVPKTLATYEAGALLGMRSVTIKKLPALVCTNPRCKDKSVVIDGAILDRMHDVLLVDVLSSSHVLCGEEVRFIRKALELSQAELADRLGVHRVTVARWESGEVPLDGPTSIAIRALAAIPVMTARGPSGDATRVAKSFERAPSSEVRTPYTLAAS